MFDYIDTEIGNTPYDNGRSGARKFFEPLTTADIKKSDWRFLIAILESYLEKHNKDEMTKIPQKRGYIMQIDKCVWNKPTKKKNMSAYIRVKLDDFVVREGISFHSDGFIGFAGWADAQHTKVFVDAFKAWASYIKQFKGTENEQYKYACKKDTIAREILENKSITRAQIRDIVLKHFISVKELNLYDLIDELAEHVEWVR